LFAAPLSDLSIPWRNDNVNTKKQLFSLFLKLFFHYNTPARRGAQTHAERRKKRQRVIVPVFAHKKDPDPKIRVTWGENAIWLFAACNRPTLCRQF
jgi:hypothetical protein